MQRGSRPQLHRTGEERPEALGRREDIKAGKEETLEDNRRFSYEVLYDRETNVGGVGGSAVGDDAAGDVGATLFSCRHEYLGHSPLAG